MQITIPQIEPALWNRLKLEARHRGVPVSELIIAALQQYLGNSPSASSQTQGIERLAGSWTMEDSQAFYNQGANFNQIDPELWQ